MSRDPLYGLYHGRVDDEDAAIRGLIRTPMSRGEYMLEPLTIGHMGRLSSSVNGNPAHAITFYTPNGRSITTRTGSDVAWVWEAENPEYHDGTPLRVRFTRSGRVVYAERIEDHR